MKRRIVLISLVVVVVIFTVVFATLKKWGLLLPNYENDIDLFMESQMASMGVPGMAMGIAGPDSVLWEGYYGTYDGEHPVSEDTVFNIASVSKTVVATAIMQLWEQGRFDLDDDINDYLDFEVRNPYYPEAAITFRHLMIHRSSIRDRYPFYNNMYTIANGGGDSPWDLGEFLEAYLVQGGQFYTGENYLDTAPGENFEYSNYGVALLAYLVEVLSGEDFVEYCHDHIFEPLGMEHSYYLLRDIPASETELAVPFLRGTALPHYSYPDYPAGSLRTTIRDLACFASFYLEPTAGDQAILQPATVELMFDEYGESTDDGEDQMGLIWVHMDWIYFNAIGHTGGDPGVATALFLYPDEDFATILFINGEPNSFFADRAVLGRLRHEGQR
jgi:CubicO group peptidase (beta-lactamase class C family)